MFISQNVFGFNKTKKAKLNIAKTDDPRTLPDVTLIAALSYFLIKKCSGTFEVFSQEFQEYIGIASKDFLQGVL